MGETTLTFRIDESLKAEFFATAKSIDRNAAQLLREFMRDFVCKQKAAAEHDAWFRRQVQIGLEGAAGGRGVPNEVVKAAMAQQRAALLAEPQPTMSVLLGKLAEMESLKAQSALCVAKQKG